MTDLITKDDPRYFSQTSDKPYDRHHYKIISQTKTIVVESWDDVQEYWWNNMSFQPPIVEVLDKPKEKPKGFKL